MRNSSMKVSVLMPTYHHESTIAQAIESFLAQEVDFEIELLINDDCSPDQTYAIAQKYAAQYPQKVKVFQQEHNQGLLKNYQFLLEQAQGEYLAVLESDDYWTDAHKLQNQVDYLDQHPNCHLSFTRVVFLKNNQTFVETMDPAYVLTDTRRTPYEHILYRNVIFSPTVMFRRSAYEKYCSIEDYIQLDFKTFDYPVWLSLLANGELHYLPQQTAVYRQMDSSISNTVNLQKKLNFERSVMEIRKYVCALYGSGSYAKWQLQLRQAVVYSRAAWKLHCPVSAAKCFFTALFF